MKRLIPLFLVVALLVCMMAVPASAESITTDDGYVYEVIDLDSPKRKYNDDNTVTVTYDVLNPGAWLRGVPDGGDAVVFEFGNRIEFSQDISMSSVSYVTSNIHDITVNSSLSDSSNFYFGSSTELSGYASSLDLLSACVGIWYNGEFYPCELFTYYNYGLTQEYYYLGNPGLDSRNVYTSDKTLVKIAARDNGLPFCLYSSSISLNSISYRVCNDDVGENTFVLVSSYEEVYEYSSEYSRVNFGYYPMGYSKTDTFNRSVVKLSDIRNGSGYEMTYDLSIDYSLIDESAMSTVYVNSWFLDADGKAVSYAMDRYNITESSNIFHTFTVPVGAEYMYCEISPFDMNAEVLEEFNFEVTSFTLSTDLTAAENSDLIQEEENSQLAGELGGKLDEVNDNLDDIEGAIDEGLGDVSDKLDDVNGNLDDVENAVGDVADKVEESNTWLENISEGITSLPQKIGEMITGLFVPDADGMAEQQDKWNQLLVDHFGAVYESVEIMDEVAAAFSIQDVQEKIEFPSVTVPLSGVDFELGGWMVDVVPDGFEFLIEILKKIIDILCTFAFVTAMRNRLEKILGGAA